MNPREIRIDDIPQHARRLLTKGNQTAQAVHALFLNEQTSFLELESPADLSELGNALEVGWDDPEAAEVVRMYHEAVKAHEEVDVRSLARWVAAHPNNPRAVADCMQVLPPPEIDIIEVLSRAGSQKLVFLAKWSLTQEEVVLKKVVAEADAAEKILRRELRPHPLTMVHPNIIETHFLRNPKGEVFLVEKLLPVLLNDRWESHGVHEAANLLFDMARALKFLHDHNLVHGDVKPDNIGRRQEDYVLLDFGICRPATEFTPEATPTGSLRTRAPELLLDGQHLEPLKVDVWALGATVFNAVAKRYPFIRREEQVPRVSTPEAREAFMQVLARRADTKWDQWVDLNLIPEPLRGVLGAMLTRDPYQRISAGEVIERVPHDLGAFLRNPSSGAGRFSPVEHLEQLDKYLPGREVVILMPYARKQTFRNRLSDLERATGFSEAERREIQLLRERLD